MIVRTPLSEITIYNSNGTIFETIPVTDGCELSCKTMQASYVTLTWSAPYCELIPHNAYIDVWGKRYFLLEPYMPECANGVYSYSVRFDDEVGRLAKVPCSFTLRDVSGNELSKEFDWVLTEDIQGFANRFMSALCEALGEEEETPQSYSSRIFIDKKLFLKGPKSVEFSCTDWLSALTSVANAFETEWLFDKLYNEQTKTFNWVLSFGREAFNESQYAPKLKNSFITLEAFNHVVPSTPPSYDRKYFNRYYVFGSTNNIDRNYKGTNINGYANRRLTLPSEYKDSCYVVPGTEHDKPLSTVLTFEEIYPRGTLVVDRVTKASYYFLEGGNRVILGYVGNDQAHPIYKTYAIYCVHLRYKNADGSRGNVFSIDNSYRDESHPDGQRIEGKDVKIKFKSGRLAGRDFNVIYREGAYVYSIHPESGSTVRVEGPAFEIQVEDDNGYQMPAEHTFVPTEGDECVIYGIRMGEEYVANAQNELLTEFKKWLETPVSDYSTVALTSNPVAFAEENLSNYLFLGAPISYVGVGTEARMSIEKSRVSELVIKLAAPWNVQLTLSGVKQQGTLTTLKQEIANANESLQLISAMQSQTKDIAASFERTKQDLIDKLNAYGKMWELVEDPNMPEGYQKMVRSEYPVYSTANMAAFGEFPSNGGSGGSGSGGSGGSGGINQDVLDTAISDALLNYAPKTHYHSATDITGLPAELESKSDKTHNHDERYLKAITSAMVQGVLTGDIASHTHSHYLSANQVGYDNGRPARFFAFPTSDDLFNSGYFPDGIADAERKKTQNYLEALLRWFTDHEGYYTQTYIGVINPNAYGVAIVHIRQRGEVGTKSLPIHSSGVYFALGAGGSVITFGTDNGVYRYGNMTVEGALSVMGKIKGNTLEAATVTASGNISAGGNVSSKTMGATDAYFDRMEVRDKVYLAQGVYLKYDEANDCVRCNKPIVSDGNITALNS